MTPGQEDEADQGSRVHRGVEIAQSEPMLVLTMAGIDRFDDTGVSATPRLTAKPLRVATDFAKFISLHLNLTIPNSAH